MDARSTAHRTRRVRRDRRSRGLRGPLLPPDAVGRLSNAELFDAMVVATVQRLERRWREQLASVEFAVEDVPSLDDWDRDWVPLAQVYPAEGALPTRIVVYRRPIETRARGKHQVRALLDVVVVEQVAELLGVDPDDIGPATAGHE